MKWAIKAQRLYDGTKRAMLHDAVVVVDNGCIAAVGPTAEVAFAPDLPVMDAGNRTVMPGLIISSPFLLHSVADKKAEPTGSYGIS